MQALSGKNMVAGVIILGLFIGCGTRDRKEPMNRSKSDPTVNPVSAKFDTEVMQIKKSDTMSKPSAEISILRVETKLSAAYKKSIEGNDKQAKANDALKEQFGIIEVKISKDKAQETDKDQNALFVEVSAYSRRGGDLSFEFAGKINAKDGVGRLTTKKTPQVVDSEKDSKKDSKKEEEVVVVTDNTKRPERKAQTVSTAAVTEPFSSEVQCLDKDCMYMVIKFLDNRKKSFYPVLVNSIALKDQKQKVSTILLAEIAEKLEVLAKSKDIKVTAGTDGAAYVIELPESAFEVRSQTVIGLLDHKGTANISVLKAGGESMGLNVDVTDVSADSRAKEVSISIVPKQ